MKGKKILRTYMKKRLNQIDDDTHKKWSNKIAESLYNSIEWQSSQIIGITISLGKEVNTKEIISKAWSENKKIAVPKCYPAEKKMIFHLITSFEQLEEGFANIMEPMEKKTSPVNSSEIDLIIVPGIVFDNRGFRIGYGGGYFDRYLDDYRGNTTSLAFEFQIIKEVVVDHYDLPVQKVISNKKVRECKH